MNLLDIISLAKAGYKKSDIDELLKIPDDDPGPDNDPESTEPENGPEGGPEDVPEDQKNEPDYKELYTNLEKEMEDLKKQLQSAQDKNRRQNNDDPKPEDAEAINDIFRNFM